MAELLKSEHVHVRVGPDLKAAINAIRVGEQRSESQVVCILLREALEARA